MQMSIYTVHHRRNNASNGRDLFPAET